MTLDDWADRAEANEPRIRRAAWIVFALGLLGFLIRGADRPADPFLLDASASSLTPPAGFEEIELVVSTADGRSLDWCTLLAVTQAARQQGLMGRRDLLGYDGMVFQFDAPSQARFYMYKTLIPLTIAFFDQNGAFVSATDMEPCPSEDPSACPTYPAARPYTHAVEMPKGSLGELGIGPGASISFVEGDCG